jgi:hypothetical protein
MEIKVLAHGNTSQAKIDLLNNASEFYAKYLNITEFKHKVYICVAPGLRKKDNVNGLCSRTGPKEISIAVDSSLPIPQLLTTLAHEMVHVKQYVRGQYRGITSRNGKMKRIWLGKQYKVSYMKRPWEIEAFRRETELVTALFATVTQKLEKS